MLNSSEFRRGNRSNPSFQLRKQRVRYLVMKAESRCPIKELGTRRQCGLLKLPPTGLTGKWEKGVKMKGKKMKAIEKESIKSAD